MNSFRSLFKSAKNSLYFPLARYFAFWARFVLSRWQPRVIVVTGSSGKTTMLHMLEAQIGTFSKVSHFANSAYGIPLDILGLSGVSGNRFRWITLLFLAPYRGLTLRRRETYYIAEADADRPGEGKFLAELLKPEITIWVSSSRTHAMNFEKLASYKQVSVSQLIADEYAHIPKATKGLVLADGDNKFVKESLKEGVEANLVLVKKEEAVKEFKLSKDQTIIKLDQNRVYSFSQPQPPVVSHQVAFLDELMKYLEIDPDYEFSRFDYPPGRSSIFVGKEGYTMIDSTYNSNLDSARAVLELFKEFPAKKKILVLGDMLEQGVGENEEHEKLGELVADMGIKYDQIILYGKRVMKNAYPVISKKLKDTPVSPLETPLDLYNFLETELKGDEAVLFKGSGFMEAVIEKLLKNPQDAQFLPRRGKAWDRRRREFGI